MKGYYDCNFAQIVTLKSKFMFHKLIQDLKSHKLIQDVKSQVLVTLTKTFL